MPRARFDHAKHNTARCKDCHDVERPRRSSDIAIPDIDSCRVCHADNTPVPNKVMRPDNIVTQATGTRLRYVNCPHTPFNHSTEANVCAGI
jgi:hypothetical protein